MKKSELTEIVREVIRETIRKVDGKYVVYPEKGGKRLGTHSSKASAEKQLKAIHINKEAVDTATKLTVLSVIDGKRNLDNDQIRQLFDDSTAGTFYVYTNEEGEYENTKPVSRQDAYKYIDYYNARLKKDYSKEEKLGAELGVLGIESELQFKQGEFRTDPSVFSANENYADGKVKEATFDDIKNLSYDKVKKTFALRKKISQAILNFFPHEDHMVKVDYYGDYIDDKDELTVKELIHYVDKRIDDNVLLNDDISIDPATDKSPTLFIDVGDNSFEITSLNDEEFFSENYADGKVKGKSRPGRVKKSGASCKGSVSDLRAKAKKYGGEKGKMYHWCANMKAGKK